MEEHGKIRGSLEARIDYSIPDAERRSECDYLADKIDELLDFDEGVGGSATSQQYSEHALRRSRLFAYNERDNTTDTLTRKSISISYMCSHGPLTVEEYRLNIGWKVVREGMDTPALSRLFIIQYFGKDRASLTTTIEQPNLVEENEPNYVSRLMTPYDHGEMLDEILWLQHLIEKSTSDDDTVY